MSGIDKGLFHWINGWTDSVAPFFTFLSEASKTTPGRILLVSLAVVLLVWKRTRKATVLALVAWPLANEFSEGFKTAIPMLRPCVELVDVNMRVGVLSSFGTASSHSANMAAIATVFCYYHWPWGAIAAVLAFLTGLSRIYVGVHYPSQVLFGWFVGALCGWVAVQTWEAYSRTRRKVAPMEKDV